jgi:hypothetical protein
VLAHRGLIAACDAVGRKSSDVTSLAAPGSDELAESKKLAAESKTRLADLNGYLETLKGHKIDSVATVGLNSGEAVVRTRRKLLVERTEAAIRRCTELKFKADNALEDNKYILHLRDNCRKGWDLASGVFKDVAEPSGGEYIDPECWDAGSPQRSHIEDIFLPNMDLDNDRKISSQEWDLWVLRLVKAIHGPLQALDQNKDGTWKDLEATLQSIAQANRDFLVDKKPGAPPPPDPRWAGLAPPDSVEALITEEETPNRVFHWPFSDYGLTARSTIADGHCQFASIAAAVYGDEKRHPDTRREVCNYLQKELQKEIGHSLFDGFFCRNESGRKTIRDDRVPPKDKHGRPVDVYIDAEAWLRGMRDDGTLPGGDTWGNQITLFAAVNLYRLRIYLLRPHQEVQVYFPENGVEAEHSIMLLSTGSWDLGHYTLLGRDGKGPAGGVPRRSPGASR